MVVSRGTARKAVIHGWMLIPHGAYKLEKNLP